MYHIAICDDDEKYIIIIKNILEEIEKETEGRTFEISQFYSGEQLVESFETGKCYDALILDMELGGIDGDETARIFREKYPYAVLAFCSGVRGPSIISFKATPYRYILKQQTVQEIKDTIREVIDEMVRRTYVPMEIVRCKGKQIKINVKDILYIENSKRGSNFVMKSGCEEYDYGEKLTLDVKPKELYDIYEKYNFELAQTACLVNMEHIKILNKEDMVLDNGDVIKISRNYQKKFKEAFGRKIANKYDKRG